VLAGAALALLRNGQIPALFRQRHSLFDLAVGHAAASGDGALLDAECISAVEHAKDCGIDESALVRV
jgi:hypothetical protein